MAYTVPPIGSPTQQSPIAQHLLEQENLNTATATAQAALAANSVTFDLDAVRPPLSVSAPAETSEITFTPNALTITPDTFDFDTFVEKGKAVDIGGLVEEYATLFPGAKEADLQPIRAIVGRARLENANRLFKPLLQNIMILLSHDEISDYKKQVALREIAATANFSIPRVLRECVSQYKKLSTTSFNVEDLVLRYILDIKGEILREVIGQSDIHRYHRICNAMGAELGLDILSTSLDPYAAGEADLDKESIREQFNSLFTPEAVVEALVTRMRREDSGGDCLDYVRSKLQEQAQRQGEDARTSAFFDEITHELGRCFTGNTINQRGVVFILRCLGILN